MSSTQTILMQLLKSEVCGIPLSAPLALSEQELTALYRLARRHDLAHIVGEALQELGVLKGEEGPYGLYIKAVNGKTLDYEKDGAYWAFYVDGAYAVTGVDETDIVETSVYQLRAEKG